MGPVPKDQSFWNFIAILAFGVVFLLLAAFLLGGHRGGWFLFKIDLLDIFIISFATFRLIRLVTFDKIVAFMRNWFMDEREGILHKPHGGIRLLIAELVECIWCTGLWAALFATWAYFIHPVGTLFVIVLAVASLGTLLQSFSKMIVAVAER